MPEWTEPYRDLLTSGGHATIREAALKAANDYWKIEAQIEMLERMREQNRLPVASESAPNA